MAEQISASPPFGRGETAGVSAVTDLVNLEGMEFTFQDINWTSSDSTKPRRTSKQVVCRCVRNVSGIALLGARLAVYSTTSGTYGNRVDGYGSTTAQKIAGVVDEFLPSGGVADKDLFWIAVEGPSSCLTNIASLGANNIAVGGPVVALTAATSQATTAGRIEIQDLSGATAPLTNQVQNLLGGSQEAATTGQTNARIIVELRRW